MTTFKSIYHRWLFALKPNSWPKLLVPFLLGQAIGIHNTGKFAEIPFVIGLLITVLGLAFIVFVNDWWDHEVDGIKREMFPDETGLKTIYDGILDRSQLLQAAITVGLLTVVVAIVGGILLGLGQLPLLTLICGIIFVSYSLPPLKLNYRGGGEFIEMLGVGLALPLMSAYLQARTLDVVGLFGMLIPAFMLMAFASALSVGLSNEQSDIKGGKRTFTTMLGNQKVKQFINVFLGLGALSLLALPLIYMDFLLLLGVLGSLFIFSFWYRKVLKLSPRAVTNAFAAQRAYKRCIHLSIWETMLFLSVWMALVS